MNTIASTSGRGSRAREIGYRFPARYRVVWIALVALILVCAITAPAALSTVSIKLVSALAGVLALAALGQLLVMMQGGIDLSVPAIITLAAAVMVKEASGHSLLVVMLIALVLAMICGLVNGLLIVVLKLNAVIVTLATGGVYSGLLLLWTGTTFSASGLVPNNLAQFTSHAVVSISSVAIVGIVVILVVGFVLRSTRAGRRFVAVGSNPTTARVVGIKPERYQIGAYTLAALLYGVGGILLAGYLTRPDLTVGSPYQLTTIAAVALGGAALGGGPASVTGTAGAAVFLVLLNQFLAVKGFNPGLQVVLQGVALIVAVALVTSLGGSGVSGFLRRLPLARSRRT